MLKLWWYIKQIFPQKHNLILTYKKYGIPNGSRLIITWKSWLWFLQSDRITQSDIDGIVIRKKLQEIDEDILCEITKEDVSGWYSK